MHYRLYYIDINYTWYDLHDLHNVSIMFQYILTCLVYTYVSLKWFLLSTG